MTRAGRWALGALGTVTLLPLAVLAGGSAYFAHAPYTIPPKLRAPDVLAEGEPPGLSLRYTGIAGYEVTDRQTTLLLDPVITRPTLLELATGPVEVDAAEIRRVFPRADYILVNHAHHDHGADAPTIAKRTGATLVGSRSMINLARAQGVPEGQLREIGGGERLDLGSFTVRVAKGDHAPLLGMPFFMRGTMTPDAEPLWFFEYLQDAAFAFHLDSLQGTLLFHPQSGYIGDRLPPADVVIFGVAGHPFTKGKLDRIRDRSEARFFLPTHYDNFFQPRDRGLAWLPVVDEADLMALRSEAPRWLLLDYDRWITFPRGTSDAVP